MRPRPTIVTIANLKGGACKTTTTLLTALSLTQRGQHVTVLDADHTGGATRWQMTARRHGDPLPFPVTPVNQTQLEDPGWVAEEHASMDWVLIDTPPVDAGIIQAAIAAAHVTIIPTQPSNLDLAQAGKSYRDTDGHGIILLTRTKAHTRVTDRAVEYLDGEGIQRFDTMIPEREAVKQLFGTSRTSPDYAAMVQELVAYVDGTEA